MKKLIAIITLIVAMLNIQGGQIRRQAEEQKGIGTPAYHEPAYGIGEAAYHEPACGIGEAAQHGY